MNLVDALELLRTGGTLMAFVCARPEIGQKALDNEKPIPIEAGFMGVITLEDIMESILQGRVFDEWDMKDRERAIGTLQRWAVVKLQTFVRRRRKSGVIVKGEIGYIGENNTDNNNSNKNTNNNNGRKSSNTSYQSSSLSPIKEVIIHRTISMEGDDTNHSNTESQQKNDDEYNNYGNNYHWDNDDDKLDNESPPNHPTSTTPLLLETGKPRFNRYT